MKKNFFRTLLVLFAFAFVLGTVDAKTAKAPTVIPDENAVLYADVDDTFDFSKIKFSTSNGSGEFSGKTNMRKIMLSSGYVEDAASAVLNDNWFSAYCLDGTYKFPMTGYAFLSDTHTEAEKLFNDALNASFYNMLNTPNTLGNYTLYELIAEAKDYKSEAIIVFEIPDGATFDYQGTLNSIKAGNEFTANVLSVTYAKTDGSSLKTFEAAELSEALYGDATKKFEVVVNKDNMMFNKYTTNKMPNTKDYNHALWIIEHTYPTFDLNTSIQMAGADVQALRDEIALLHAASAPSDDELTELVENYVYSTVQYAIWYVYDGVVDADTGYTLGNNLTGSTQLNILYKYLIKDREEYNTYSTKTFSSTFGLNYPDPKEILVKETDDYYKYGPFSITSGLVSYDSATVKAEGAKGVKMVDVAGNEITSVNAEQNFYVIADKDANVTNVSVEIATENGYVFEPANNRGRVYYSNYPLAQNVVTGGIVKPATATQSFELVFNPKTGVEDVAILLVITLVSFAIGYFVLKFNNQPAQF